MPLRYGAAKFYRKPVRSGAYQRRDDPTRLIAERGERSIRVAVASALKQFRRAVPVAAMAAKIEARDLTGAADLVNVTTLEHDLKGAFAAIVAVMQRSGERAAGDINAALKASRIGARGIFKEFNPDQPRDARGRWIRVDTPADLEKYRVHPQTRDELLASQAQLKNDSLGTPLSAKESHAVNDYTGVAYRGINGNLRAGKRPGVAAKLIDSAIEKFSLSESTVLFRGVNADVIADNPKFLAPGAVISDRGFMSTSLKESVARNFSLEGGYTLAIYAKAGASALSIGGTTIEYEVLLPRLSTLKILSVEGTTIRAALV
jgi:hypothetical protein